MGLWEGENLLGCCFLGWGVGETDWVGENGSSEATSGCLELGMSSKKGLTVLLKLDGKSACVVEATNGLEVVTTGLEVVTTGLDGGATGSNKLPC